MTVRDESVAPPRDFSLGRGPSRSPDTASSSASAAAASARSGSARPPADSSRPSNSWPATPAPAALWPPRNWKPSSESRASATPSSSLSNGWRSWTAVLLLVMELADRNLQSVLFDYQNQGQPGIPRKQLLGFLSEAAEALDVINFQYGLQHLDVKPHNLFVVSNHVKVADFGLVNRLPAADADPSARRRGGATPLYASPETLQGSLSRQSDQYSLAIVYQQLLTGTVPFWSANPYQLLLKHLSGQPDLSALPASDQPLVARALAKAPEQRFGSCLDFVRCAGRCVRPRFRRPAEPASFSRGSVPGRRQDPAVTAAKQRGRGGNDPVGRRRVSPRHAGRPAAGGRRPRRTGRGGAQPPGAAAAAHRGVVARLPLPDLRGADAAGVPLDRPGPGRAGARGPLPAQRRRLPHGEPGPAAIPPPPRPARARGLLEFPRLRGRGLGHGRAERCATSSISAAPKDFGACRAKRCCAASSPQPGRWTNCTGRRNCHIWGLIRPN